MCCDVRGHRELWCHNRLSAFSSKDTMEKVMKFCWKSRSLCHRCISCDCGVVRSYSAVVRRRKTIKKNSCNFENENWFVWQRKRTFKAVLAHGPFLKKYRMNHFAMLTAYEQPVGFGVSRFLAVVLVALWSCNCSLPTFSDLVLVFFVISHVSFCLQIWCTEDASLTQNRFPNKAICGQMRLRRPCAVLMLNSWNSIAHRSVNSRGVFNLSP